MSELPSFSEKIHAIHAMNAALSAQGLYFNRELSILDFNERVLEQAQNASTPLLERLRFLCITSTNLDEFFEVHVASLKQRALSSPPLTPIEAIASSEILSHISIKTHALVAEQYRILNQTILSELHGKGVVLLDKGELGTARQKWFSNYFQSEIMPILSPLGLDPAHPFPRVLNKSLNFIVSLEGKDAFGRPIEIAVVPAPRSLPRLIQVPSALSCAPFEFILLADMIRMHMHQLFPDMYVRGAYEFRVTRNSNLFFDEEEIDDLLVTLEGELPSRGFGDAVRVEVDAQCSSPLQDFLLAQLNLSPQDLYLVPKPVNLNRLDNIYDLVDRLDFKYTPFVPATPPSLSAGANLFEVIHQSDILLHHPFESFTPVVDLLRQAAHDPNVLAIKQTLYRTGDDSILANYLIDAATAGKEVTVVIELRARFDEETNISLATRLQEAGAHVVYGIVGYKTHSKMLMIVRREPGGLQRYVHLGTGNYHTRTSQIYTDYGILTCDPHTTEDVHAIFLQLTALGKTTPLKKLLQSPFNLQASILERIKKESLAAHQGKKAHIMIKVNALSDPHIIQAFYKASQAGVEIDLIVRGICSLRPGLPGISERIRVRSIIGRFLEHTRVYYFHNEGAEEVFLASADFMSRNLSQRVEIAFPIEDVQLKKRIIHESFELYLQDNLQAWDLGSDGIYKKKGAPAQKKVSAQKSLLEELVLEHREK